jgi:hypothetical protein
MGFGQNHFNEVENCSKAKCELSEYIATKIEGCGAAKKDGDSYVRQRSEKFNIWLFKPKAKKTP